MTQTSLSNKQLNVESWSVNEVCNWLKGLGPDFDKYEAYFEARQIDGRKLSVLEINDLTKILADETNVNIHKAIYKAVQNLFQINHDLTQDTLQGLIYNVKKRVVGILHYTQRIESCKCQTSSLTGQQTTACRDCKKTIHEIVRLSKYLIVAHRKLFSWLLRLPFSTMKTFDEFRHNLLEEQNNLQRKINDRNKNTSKYNEEIRESLFQILDHCTHILKHCDKNVDAENGKLCIMYNYCYLEKVALYNEPDKKLGIRWDIMHSNIYTVIEIACNSIAHQCPRLNIGDDLFGVDGQIIIGWSLENIKKLIDTQLETKSCVFFLMRKMPSDHASNYHQMKKTAVMASSKSNGRLNALVSNENIYSSMPRNSNPRKQQEQKQLEQEEAASLMANYQLKTSFSDIFLAARDYSEDSSDDSDDDNEGQYSTDDSRFNLNKTGGGSSSTADLAAPAAKKRNFFSNIFNNKQQASTPATALPTPSTETPPVKTNKYVKSGKKSYSHTNKIFRSMQNLFLNVDRSRSNSVENDLDEDSTPPPPSSSSKFKRNVPTTTSIERNKSEEDTESMKSSSKKEKLRSLFANLKLDSKKSANSSADLNIDSPMSDFGPTMASSSAIRYKQQQSEPSHQHLKSNRSEYQLPDLASTRKLSASTEHSLSSGDFSSLKKPPKAPSAQQPLQQQQKKQSSSTKTLMEGWLYKRRRGTTTITPASTPQDNLNGSTSTKSRIKSSFSKQTSSKWQKYWCVLTKDFIAFYKSQDERQPPKDYILLKNFMLEPSATHANCFQVHDKTRQSETEFYAESADDFGEWYHHLSELRLRVLWAEAQQLNSQNQHSFTPMSSTSTPGDAVFLGGGGNEDSASVNSNSSSLTTASANSLGARKNTLQLQLSTIVDSSDDLSGLGGSGGGETASTTSAATAASAIAANSKQQMPNTPSSADSLRRQGGGKFYASSSSRESSPDRLMGSREESPTYLQENMTTSESDADLGFKAVSKKPLIAQMGKKEPTSSPPTSGESFTKTNIHFSYDACSSESTNSLSGEQNKQQPPQSTQSPEYSRCNSMPNSLNASSSVKQRGSASSSNEEDTAAKSPAPRVSIHHSIQSPVISQQQQQPQSSVLMTPPDSAKATTTLTTTSRIISINAVNAAANAISSSMLGKQATDSHHHHHHHSSLTSSNSAATMGSFTADKVYRSELTITPLKKPPNPLPKK